MTEKIASLGSITMTSDPSVGVQPGTHQALWADQAPRLLRAAIALGIPPADAPDLVQETLLAAFASSRRFDPARASFTTWTHTILLRRCANWRRHLYRFHRMLARLSRLQPVSTTSCGDSLEARLSLERLASRLSRTQRQILTLVDISGLSPAEVATVLRMNPATVRSHLRHARAALRRAAAEET